MVVFDTLLLPRSRQYSNQHASRVLEDRLCSLRSNSCSLSTLDIDAFGSIYCFYYYDMNR